jgi:acetyltransferase
MGGNAVAEAESLLNVSGVPTFPHPDAAVRAFCLMARYSSNLRALYETPVHFVGSPEEICQERVERILRKVREAGRPLLTEMEAKEILSSYGIPILERPIALSEEEAVELTSWQFTRDRLRGGSRTHPRLYSSRKPCDAANLP